jgi:hypothetical protein
MKAITADQLGSNFLVDRIGPVCPFCGKNWSDSGPCGDPDPELGPRAWKDRFAAQRNRERRARRANVS